MDTNSNSWLIRLQLFVDATLRKHVKFLQGYKLLNKQILFVRLT